MAITDVNTLQNALGNVGWPMPVNKASVGNAISGGFYSLWRATGTPGQGAIPGAAAICDKSLTGAWPFPDPSSGRSYLGRLWLSNTNAITNVEIHDRLGHMGGLSGTVATAQAVNLDLTVATSNLTSRKFTDDYTCVQWWLEWYTDTGATAVTATVSYTDANGVSKTCTVSLTATMRAGRMMPILPTDGIRIRSVQSVTLSATTGTAGSFGVTATVPLTSLGLVVANKYEDADWAALGLPRIHDSACLQFIIMPTTSTTGILTGSGKLAQG